MPEINQDLFYYVSVNKQLVLAIDRFERKCEKYIEKIKSICDVYGASGFYPTNSFAQGFGFDSFIFKKTVNPDYWSITSNGGYLPKVALIKKSLNQKLKVIPPVTYHETFKLLGSTPNAKFCDNLQILKLIDDVVIIGMKKPLDTFGICIPTTKEYVEYLLNNEF
jgi:hypothetical protein